MLIDANSLKELYTEGKFWVAFLGFMWSAFKTVQWVKDIKEKDIPAIKSSVDQVHGAMVEQNIKMDVNTREQTATIMNCFKDQTSAVVRELQEQRADMRTFLYPQAPAVVATAKPKRVRRPAAKKPAPAKAVKKSAAKMSTKRK